MINGFKVITLCGSTRFKDDFLEAQKRLTLEGNIVISVGLFGHSGDNVVWTEGVKDMLDRQHLAKIDLADEIFVINVGGYIGESTRREIAYAEFKGKTIKYMENSKKANIYENYAALRELHDAGRISDEDFEKAGRDFDEKRKALIAEYNACQGPWPYQWKNTDTVVCGILQQMGVVSLDYSDLKDLYDADCVCEVRIKGKGANDEEQLQSIIDTIRREYLSQLRSSKKVVVTLRGSSNPSDLLEKLADCMVGLNVVWQTRTMLANPTADIEISFVYEYIRKMKVYAHYEKINGIEYRWRTLLQLGDSWDVCGTVIMKNPGSSHPVKWKDNKPIPINNIEILKNLNQFDDFNSFVSKEWFDFSVDSTMGHVGNLIKAYLRYNKLKEEGIIQIFNLFNVIDQSLGEAINNYDPQVVNTIEDDIKSLKQYCKLPIYIGWGDIWRNKLFNDNARRFFDAVKAETHYLDPSDIGKNFFYHPQYLLGVGKNRSQCIIHYGNFLTNKKDNQNEFVKILALKDKINKDGANQWIDPDGMLVHEYYCKGKKEDYVKKNGTIVIGLKIDSKGNKYVLSIISTGNHPDKFVAKVQEICDESKLFKMDANLNFVADVETDDGKIVEFFNDLLAIIKEYRETDLPE